MESLNNEKFPEKIETEDQLEELLSRPDDKVSEMFSRLDGDILILGITGKIGPSLANMARRACEKFGIKKRIIGVSRHGNREQEHLFRKSEIEIRHGDLLDINFIRSLPNVKNVFFLAGMKFGSIDNLPETWAINTYLPALVADHFKDSRIVAFSTGCVYPLVPLENGGSVETDMPIAAGEYAQSCLGRERMFEFGSNKNKTEVALIRLNYSVEMRYGVLTDIALKVKNNLPVDLTMGYFNVIWQGDMNNFVLRSLEYTKSPATILNITGPEILSVRDVAIEFGKLFGVDPKFVNKEAETALLNNPAKATEYFGKPATPVSQIIKWIAGWLMDNNKLLGKPTHFEVRDGKY
ncbi:MAG TPA: epimerase [Bacteroidales bacterium]|nr:epimerase [Bacteroidales bacterium]HPT22774.1 epimerase [Bacteroidales bacterium]